VKRKKIIAGLGFIILFIIAINLIPRPDKVYYEFEKYRETIDSPISGKVTRIIEGKNFFGVQIGSDSNNYYGFTYQVERTPKQWIDNYPENFIAEGDSIEKKSHNDTFIVIRNSQLWTYILPIDSTNKKYQTAPNFKNNS
jgi:hypothetical protein